MIRSRFAVYWVVFLLVSLGLAAIAGSFVYRELVRFREQGEISVATQFVQSEAQLASLVEEIKEEATRQLVSFHTEGLEFQLNKWANENPLLQSTFVWRNTSGFRSSGELVLDDPESYPWKLVWNIDGELLPNEQLADSGILAVDPVYSRTYATGESYGYLRENLEILAYAGIETNPYVGWMRVEVENQLQWIFWHQLAQDEEVRGLVLDLNYLYEQAQAVITNLVASDIEVELVSSAFDETVDDFVKTSDLGVEFPGWHLRVQLSDAAEKQESIILLSGALVVGLFLLLIAGGSAVIFKSYGSFQEIMQKTTFVSAVSHELKTPLTSIRMYSELLESEKLEPEKRAQFTNAINRESQRLTSLINNLLTFSSIEHGKRKFLNSNIDLASLIRTTLRDYEKVIHYAGVECEIRMPESKAWVTFDESVLKMVLINLIENVLKHARKGGWIGIWVEEGSEDVFLEISDRGPGIPAKYRNSIFEPFFQVETRMDSKKPGAGLGLSVARSMMQGCGGDLQLVSKEEAGATFRMILKKRG